MSRTLLEQWRDMAYDETVDRGQLQRFWGTYFQIEKEIRKRAGGEIRPGSYDDGRVPGRNK